MVPIQEIVFLWFQLPSVASYDHISSSGENQENQTRGGKSTSETLSVNTALDHICRNNHSSQTSHPSSPIISSSISSTDKQCGLNSINRSSTITGLPSGDSLIIRGSKDRAGRVGSSSNHPQSMASDITSTGHDYKDRCLSNGLGCPTSRVPNREAMISRRDTNAYQCTGASGSVSCTEVLAKDRTRVNVLIQTDNKTRFL